MDNQQLTPPPAPNEPTPPPSAVANTPAAAAAPVPTESSQLPTYGAPNGHTGIIAGSVGTTTTAGPRRLRGGTVIAGLAGGLLLTCAVYFLVLPAVWSSSYVSRIKPAYQKQSSQLTAVFQSLGRPVFTGSNASATSNSQDFQYISGVIQTALTNTASLKASNQLTVLPLTAWQHNVASANSHYQAMRQYVSDSQTFLSDYKTLVIYTEQIGQIAQVQLPSLAKNLDLVNKGSNNLAAFTADLQAASSNLQSFINQLKGLKAPPDMQLFNQTLLTDLTDMNSALSAQQTDIQANDALDFRHQAAVYVSSYKDFVGLLESNPTANIQTSSALHDEITTLQGEHPLR